MVRAKVKFDNGVTKTVAAESFVRLFEALKDKNIVKIDARETDMSDFRQGKDIWV